MSAAAVEPVATPVVGWRAWWVGETRVFDEHGWPNFDKGIWLRSIGVRASWTPDPQPARCVKLDLNLFATLLGAAVRVVDHPAPSQGCSCGYWAFRDRHVLERELGVYWASRPPDASLAIGQVEMWGRIVETERGWRAEYARPLSLELVDAPYAHAAMLIKSYRVPAKIVALPKATAQAARRHRWLSRWKKLRLDVLALAIFSNLLAGAFNVGVYFIHPSLWRAVLAAVQLGCACWLWRRG